MERSFSNIIANDDLCSYFANSIRNNSTSHAFILLGAKGTGKHTLARQIAAALSCECKEDHARAIPCLECNSCKKIMDGNSPDVIYISREEDKATLGIDPIRFIRDDVSYYPNDGEYKVYIIEDAHTMTTQAQNAFLLTLEEPPSYVVFILLCENTENILDTIKSRAPILRMKTPSEEEAIDFFKANNPTIRNFISNYPDDFKQIYLASGGSIGRIIELATSSERKQILQNRMLAQKLIEAVAHRTLSSDFAEISGAFSQKKDEREKIVAQLTEIQSALRDIMVLKKADEPKMTFFTDIHFAEELSYCFSTQKITEIIENTEKARLALLKNANVKLTVINYLSSLL